MSPSTLSRSSDAPPAGGEHRTQQLALRSQTSCVRDNKKLLIFPEYQVDWMTGMGEIMIFMIKQTQFCGTHKSMNCNVRTGACAPGSMDHSGPAEPQVCGHSNDPQENHPAEPSSNCRIGPKQNSFFQATSFSGGLLHSSR